MTDQIELPPVPQSPPVVSLKGSGSDGSVIKFDVDKNKELTVELSIRDEDVTETLEARWRVVSNARPIGVPENQFTCPEPQIAGVGMLERKHLLVLQDTSFAPGKCSRVDVLISASFKSCKPDAWLETTQEDDETDVGRLSFWVWAVDASNDPLTEKGAVGVTTSCPAIDFMPPPGTTSPTPAASGI